MAHSSHSGAAQALNGQLPNLAFADADADSDEEERTDRMEQLEQRQLLGAAAMPRKQSLSERRHVELPLLKVVNEREPKEPEAATSTSTPTPTPTATPTPSPEAFAPGLRRNSISMPSGINALDLEALRLRHQMQPQDALHEEMIADDATSSQSTPGAPGTPVTPGTSDTPAPTTSANTPEEVVSRAAINFVSANDDSDDEFGGGRRPVHR